MPQPRYTPDEAVRLAEALYQSRIRAIVEPTNVGRFITIDIESGDYLIGDDYHTVSRQMLAAKPDAALAVLRIGYRAPGRIGGHGRLRQP